MSHLPRGLKLDNLGSISNSLQVPRYATSTLVSINYCVGSRGSVKFYVYALYTKISSDIPSDIPSDMLSDILSDMSWRPGNRCESPSRLSLTILSMCIIMHTVSSVA